MEEASRKVIMREQNNNGTGTPWQDMNKFSCLVYQQTMKDLQSRKDSIFCDRSLLDNAAYLQYADLKNEIFLEEFDYDRYYQRKVFFAPSWEEIYEQDEQRPEKFEELNGLDKVLIDTYRQKGYDLIFLPKKSVIERVEFVLQHVESEKTKSIVS
ncbi:hypothetical protein AUTU_00590 [Aureibacter tunicatorum]|nr:hypothetical protein AUTU_00590 [Aureibacter tunicatorum]